MAPVLGTSKTLKKLPDHGVNTHRPINDALFYIHKTKLKSGQISFK